MLDFPIGDLLDEDACLSWLEKHLHPQGLQCPNCGSQNRRRAKQGGAIPAFRCKECDRYHTILTGTVFERTQQKPSTLVLMLRGITRGEATARLARELGISRKQMTTIRHRLQQSVETNLPDGVMADSGEFEADELYQNAGEKRSAPPRPGRPTAPTRQQGQRAGHLGL
jgi:transposase-like protein